MGEGRRERVEGIWGDAKNRVRENKNSGVIKWSPLVRSSLIKTLKLLQRNVPFVLSICPVYEPSPFYTNCTVLLIISHRYNILKISDSVLVWLLMAVF